MLFSTKQTTEFIVILSILSASDVYRCCGYEYPPKTKPYAVQRRLVTSTSSLETVVETLSQKVDSLQQYASSLNDELQAKIYHQSQKIDKLEAQVQEQQSHDEKGHSGPVVAFLAHYQPDIFSDNVLNASAPLVANKILTNQGGAYDNVTGIFRATSNGTFVFALHLFSTFNTSAVMQVDIVTGWTQAGSVTILCGARTSSAQSGDVCQAVVPMAAGQGVWLRNLWDHAKYWPGLTSFSGFLLNCL